MAVLLQCHHMHMQSPVSVCAYADSFRLLNPADGLKAQLRRLDLGNNARLNLDGVPTCHLLSKRVRPVDRST